MPPHIARKLITPSSIIGLWLTGFVTWVVLCMLPLATASAHEIRPAIVNLNFSGTSDGGSTLSINMMLNLEGLIAGIGPEHADTDASQNAGTYKQLRDLTPSSLLSEFNQFEDRFVSGIKIVDELGGVIPLKVESVSIPPVGDTELPRDSTIVMRALIEDKIVALSWQWREEFGEVILRANSDATEIDYATLLSPGQQSDVIQFTDAVKRSAWQVFSQYIVVGFEHILPKGLDHILFVIGLFLLTTRWRALLAQVTVFTLAHSLTLALGITGWLRVSSSIVEPLIALSIVFVCVENLLTNRVNKWRIATVFGFGLLHGLGFASVLGEVGLDGNNFVVALLGFNVGVELGQLAVIAACFIGVGLWFGNKPYYRRWITRPASIVVGLIGVYWFVERTLL